MSPSDFWRLPPAVRTLVVVMLWPALWAGALAIVALTGDLIRQMKTEQFRAARPRRPVRDERDEMLLRTK